MRRLLATLVVGIALAGAIYLGSVRLGNRFYAIGCGLCWPPSPAGSKVVVYTSRADWQIPISILVGVVGIAGGLVMLRTRRKQPAEKSPRTA